MLKVPYSRQNTDFSCGPASLKMVFEFFGLKESEKKLRKIAKTTHYGTMHRNLINTSRDLGFYCHVEENSSFRHIKYFLGKKLPVIIDYIEPSSNEGHYSVVIGLNEKDIILNDPWNGKSFRISKKRFLLRWRDNHKGYRCKRWIMVISKEKLAKEL